MTPAILLVELMAVYYGWTFFDNGPLAFYVSVGIWVAWRCTVLGFEKGGSWWPVCLFGAFLGLTQAGCGLMYAGDGRSFICDKGTGLPISLVVLSGAAGLAAYYARLLRAKL